MRVLSTICHMTSATPTLIMQRMAAQIYKFGVGALYGNVNPSCSDSSLAHRMPTDLMKLFTLAIVDWTFREWSRGKLIWVVLPS